MITLRLGFLASHGGSNVQAILNACKNDQLKADPCVVISNNSGSQVLGRAKRENIPYRHLSTKTHPESDDLDIAIANTLHQHQVNLVILAGYMKKLGPIMLSRFRNRILNTHPALLPSFGGRGMYGIRVHKAVLAAGEKFSGVTIHLVESNYDQGQIISQAKTVVLGNDTPTSLRERILQHEHQLYVEVLQKISTGEIDLDSIAKNNRNKETHPGG